MKLSNPNIVDFYITSLTVSLIIVMMLIDALT